MKELMIAEDFHDYAEEVGGPIQTEFDPEVFAVLFDWPEHWRIEWHDGRAYYRKLNSIY